MKERSKFILFCTNFLLVYIAMGVTYCMMVSYLISLNYTASERSYMYAVGAIIGMIGQFVIGYLCDKDQTIKKYSNYIFVVYIFASLALYLTGFRHFALHLFIVAINITMMRLASGIMDSWAIESGDYCKEHYGFIRAFGSIGWAIGSALVSFIIDAAGYRYVGYCFAISVIIILLFFAKTPDAIKTAEDPVNFKDLGKLLTNKGYLLLMIIFFSVCMMQASLDYTIIDKLEFLGATSAQISNYWSLMAIVELPLFFIGSWCVNRFGTIKLLIIATVAYALRLVLYGAATTVQLMLIISVLQAITFPLFTIVTKLLIDEETPENLRSSGQQIGLALYSSTSALLSPLLAGALEDRFGVDVAIYAISLFGLISVALTLIYIKYKKNA